jgi:hypothetical protein
MTIEETQKLLNLRSDANKKESEWIKIALSMLSIILGLIISLRPKSDIQISICVSIVFIITVSIIGFCILFGLISLYSHTETSHSLADEYAKNISSPSKSGGTFLTVVAPKPFFLISRKLFFFFLPLSIISLIVFASLNELIK